MVRQHVQYSGGLISTRHMIVDSKPIVNVGHVLHHCFACFKRWFAWFLVKLSGPLPQHPKTKTFFDVAQINRMSALQSLEAMRPMPVFDKERN